MDTDVVMQWHCRRILVVLKSNYAYAGQLTGAGMLIGRVELLAGSQGMLLRVFKAAAELMEEGREDTRAYAKRTVWAVAQLAAVSEPGGFDRMLKQLSSAHLCCLSSHHLHWLFVMSHLPREQG